MEKTTFNDLLKEHIMNAFIDANALQLHDFVQQLICNNEGAREDILKAYQQIQQEHFVTADVY
jgi:hypothetical protein